MTLHVISFSVVFFLQVITAIVGAILASNLQAVIGWNGMFFLVAGFTFLGKKKIPLKLRYSSLCMSDTVLSGMLLTFSFNAKDYKGDDI
jgi:hypothetical protein